MNYNPVSLSKHLTVCSLQSSSPQLFFNIAGMSSQIFESFFQSMHFAF